jgi:hypothetical protein
LNVRVIDVDEAYGAFVASPWVDGDAEGRAPLTSVLPEITAFFEKITTGWTTSLASEFFTLVTTDGTPSPLSDAFASLLDVRRDIFIPNVAALRQTAGAEKLAIAVGPLADAPRGSAVVPVVPFGSGAIVGPIRVDGRPCRACVERTVRIHDLTGTETPSLTGARLLALRVLETLLTKPLIPYFSAYVFFRDALDEHPVHNQALRFPDCDDCQRTRTVYPPRRLRDTHDDAVRILRTRRVLA